MVFWNGKFTCDGCVSHLVGCTGIMDATGRAKESPRVEKCKAEALARYRAFREAERSRAERYGYDTETCRANAAECGAL